MSTTVIAYIPVLHKGYLDFLKKANPQKIFLIGDDVLKFLPDTDYLQRKDKLRALEAEETQKNLQSLGFSDVEILTDSDLKQLNTEEHSIVMPDEDVSRSLQAHFLDKAKVQFSSAFLRWHRDNTKADKEAAFDRKISQSEFDKKIMSTLDVEAQKSFDWWRQVAAAVIKDGEVVLMGHNKHMPDEQSPNVFGDPRSVSKRGIDFHITTSAHAELALVGEAAKRGITLDGASIYVTDFPCPFCARIIAHAGFSKCFFRKGYANLDGDEFLKGYGVELVYVADD